MKGVELPMMVAGVSYLAATLAYASVLLLTLFLWRGRLQGGWLLLALGLMVVWSGYLGLNSGGKLLGIPSSEGPDPNQFFLEIVRDAAWVLLLWRLHASNQGIGSPNFWSNRWLWGFFPLLIVLLLGNILQFSLGERGKVLPASLTLISPFMLVILALILLEQWYRNIPGEQRWSVKFFCVGTAVVFGYDFLLYSEALLFNRVDATLWQVRGLVCAVVAPLMAVSIARSKEGERQLRLSHRAVFFSTGLFLAGIYLLVMSMVGYYLRWFESSLGSAIRVVFVVVALSLLCLLIGSGRFRAIVAVWVSKHFLSYKYDYRAEWMKANEHFSALPLDSNYYEQLIQGMADPLDSLGGILWVREGGEFVVKGSSSVKPLSNLSKREDGVLLDFCQESGWVIEVPEYRVAPAQYGDLQIADRLLEWEELWLLVPLLHQGVLHGLVGLAHPRAERTLNWEDHDLLKALGSQLAALITLRETTDQLAANHQFEAYYRFSAFVVHDIKNVVAQLSMVVKNAERHKHNPEFVDDALDTLDNAVQRMNRMLSQLKQQGALAAHAEVVNALDIARAVEQNQKSQQPRVELVIPQGLDTALKLKVERDKLVSVLGHLVQNAQEATPAEGFVRLLVDNQDGMAIFSVMDNGCGMSEQFQRERLFKPFDTTKGRAGMGIGVYETRQFVVQNQGSLKVSSALGQGSEFRVALPAYKVHGGLESEIGKAV
uniref:XrtA/PEP-CTERM system histidine kinase PrsK n=1 Tax=Marinobacterium profundum TaxID=1714300 RepID=UPI000A989086|nr:XrtA/PEP-CTERM system histidine kinase PrsK [Marinobacterium profundum]